MGGAMSQSQRFYYEGNFLYWVDHKGKIHQPKARSGSVSSVRCEDCDIRGALNERGLPYYCSECRTRRKKGKKRCVSERCANGCEACGGTGRVPT